ncbi:TPA: tyrosine-type recombinase/integrase [Citrobacter koseri]|uniref:site-specific integrase n=1 Tax=uncultured Citrobacter sp. TaxID=200446 RepID=UPI002594F742|nr:site-specific integrase [uncultured Citrobacter sp.]
MPSNNIHHHLYKRNHTWWFRKRFVFQSSAIEFRVSLKTTNLSRARLLALHLQPLCLRLVTSLGGHSLGKKSMDKTVQEQISARLRAQVAEWTAEETERWFSRSNRTEGDLNQILENIDMHMSDLKERIACDDKPHLHQAEANTILDKLPHVRASLSEDDIKEIAREVASAKVESLQETRDIILGRKSRMFSLQATAPHPASPVEQQESLTLSQLFEQYTNENKAKKLAGRTYKKYDWYRALVISFFGDIQIHTITGAMGRQLYENLTKLPLNLQKEDLLSASLLEIIEKSTAQPIGLVTANGHHGKIAQFFDWVVDRKHIQTSPFPSKGLPLPKKNHKDDRQAITDAEAKLVFNQPLFTSHQGFKTTLVQHPHHFFLPLICLTTGMRTGEVAQLYIDDIEDVKGVSCIRVDRRHDDQWLKTPNAKRYIPLHEELIRLGFLRFVSDLTEKFGKNSRLFPNIPLIQDSYSAKPSEWFIANFRNSLDQPKHVTLHGFRHMFRDKLTNVTDSDERICRLMGHQTSNYGSSLPPEQQAMKELVNSIDFHSIVSDVKPYTSLSMFHKLNGRA